MITGINHITLALTDINLTINLGMSYETAINRQNSRFA